MKIDIGASFHDAKSHLLNFDDLHERFKVRHWPSQSLISIELTEEHQSKNIEDAINSFFIALGQYKELKGLGGELRVAVYFSPDEAAAFSVALSRQVIRQLWEYEMDIEVNGYPCSD
ncbi:hypothetical protein [Dyella choica]|uniref:Uncharacterized protein n=1 Tax=Dyella choica TaxID=1927959 RepID=A0A432M353_9GAMM|nr:hypothetical protein [Dyella choica]RUL72999.1 hypothetical protein EKH80_16725 [Dyella choica]